MTATKDYRHRVIAPDDTLALRAAARRTFHFILAVPCNRHHALIGEPCWTFPYAESDGDGIGICSHRLDAAKANQRATAEGRALPGPRRRGRRGGRR
ncbi:hypothetical protein [Brachybacterium paraconglomeratum]|uniref:hypothetical protein n=1 Tax=Brachybacterium paraconglomeratum TaxID=173362 RepID=UPI002492750B|nr:hypothetical protein [Brachybacterium paraconglomeratum]